MPKPKLMLAKPIKPQILKAWTQMEWERMWLEPKIDGVRLVRENMIWQSRQGKRLNHIKHLTSKIDKILKSKSLLVDGELTAGDWSSTISVTNASMSERDLTRLRLIIFQVVNISKIDEPYTDRRERAVELAEAIGSKAISAIPVQTVSSYDEFQQAFNLHVASGCDGVMLKLRTGVYEQRRSPLWLKVKPYFEINGKIVGFKEGIGKYKDTLGSIGIVLPLPNGRWETEVTHVSGMTDAERNLIWENRKRFLGRVIEVAYRAKSADGLLIEPRVIPNKIGL